MKNDSTAERIEDLIKNWFGIDSVRCAVSYREEVGSEGLSTVAVTEVRFPDGSRIVVLDGDREPDIEIRIRKKGREKAVRLGKKTTSALILHFLRAFQTALEDIERNRPPAEKR